MRRVAIFVLLCLIITSLAAAQNAPVVPPGPEAQKCAGLLTLNLEEARGGPALITSARLVDVPASGLEQWPITTSGYGKMGVPITTQIGQYCDVIGYVAPQNNRCPHRARKLGGKGRGAGKADRLPLGQQCRRPLSACLSTPNTGPLFR